MHIYLNIMMIRLHILGQLFRHTTGAAPVQEEGEEWLLCVHLQEVAI